MADRIIYIGSEIFIAGFTVHNTCTRLRSCFRKSLSLALWCAIYRQNFESSRKSSQNLFTRSKWKMKSKELSKPVDNKMLGLSLASNKFTLSVYDKTMSRSCMNSSEPCTSYPYSLTTDSVKQRTSWWRPHSIIYDTCRWTVTEC